MSTLPTELFGYRVVAKLGSGAASELYAVQDPKTKQVWALKHVVRHDEKGARFIEQVEQEHAIGSKLDHPNVRGVSKVHRTRKLFTTTEIGLLLELVDADAMDQRMPRNMLEAVDQFRQIADGLAHMHERGFVHADMKPINAMVCANGDVKIIDLGQACAIGTKKKRIQGTPGYIAPEQAQRDAVTAATDVYNLGATMHWGAGGRGDSDRVATQGRWRTWRGGREDDPVAQAAARAQSAHSGSAERAGDGLHPVGSGCARGQHEAGFGAPVGHRR
jgi:serine/threonine-protein kinase